MSSSFHQYKLTGHRKPVLCLAHSSQNIALQSHSTTPPCCLLSGSEDGTMRCWDLKSSKASICIVAPSITSSCSNEVSSVAFHPYWGYDHHPPSPFSLPFTVFMSFTSHVYAYDLRKVSTPIVRSPPDKDLSTLLQNKDDVNQICLERTRGLGNRSSKSISRLVTADDAGHVRITTFEDTDKTGTCTILAHGEEPHTCPFVTSIDLRPRVKNLQIASGATDSCVRLWDIAKPRKPESILHIPMEGDIGVNQLCNPPIVHSLQWSPSGKLLACGLGDGSALILSCDGRTLYESYRLREGHGGPVASVLFPSFSTMKQSTQIQADDRLLFTAGNDGNILLWDLGRDVAGEKAMDPCHIFKKGFLQTDVTSLEHLSTISLTSPPKVMLGISHKHKPNWLVSSSSSDTVMPTSLFAADTSTDITIYRFPVDS